MERPPDPALTEPTLPGSSRLPAAWPEARGGPPKKQPCSQSLGLGLHDREARGLRRCSSRGPTSGGKDRSGFECLHNCKPLMAVSHGTGQDSKTVSDGCCNSQHFWIQVAFCHYTLSPPGDAERVTSAPRRAGKPLPAERAQRRRRLGIASLGEVA